MSWFASLFSSSSSKNTRSPRSAMSSTHEAFSLPTSSPGLSHPDAFNPETLQTPTRTSSSPTSYSYPPQSPVGSYDYVPTSSRSRQSSILPLHNAPSSPSYPPLLQTWNRLRTWLGNEYPELGDTLNFGILPEDLAQVEMAFGFALPQTVRDSYLCVDGQEPESAAGCSEGLFFGLTLLPLEDVLEEWRFWREVDSDPNTGANPKLKEIMQSIPPGWVRKEYSCRGWIPLIADKAGNYLGIDMNPDEGGAVGQVIVFGRDFDTKVVMWRGDGPGGWARWLAGFVEDLESGEGYELGNGNEGSDDSEDSVGYESYFFDGVGRGSGDGGGDPGSGGMRLAGEYRGWNVLEAWADRSVRKWQEAGLLPEPTLTPPTKAKAAGTVPAPLNLSGAEVPIPVLQEESSTTPLANATNRESSRQPIPTISVTKPPVPRPVDVPTQDDIIVTVDSPIDDLESGGGVISGFQPKPTAIAIVNVPTRSSSTSQAAAVPLPSSPAQPPTTSAPISPAPGPVPDLLEDSAPILPTPPILPSSPASPNFSNEGSTVLVKSEEDSPVLVSNEEAIDKALENTVRLVGGGVPIVSNDSSNDGVLVSEPESEPVDIPSPSTDQSSNNKHDRKSGSISSSLKRISQLGSGKRKKDSTSSVKEVV
ncbi:hypothetical protein C8Q75DRAFT_10744 [Abortiporus biennis]|nr:hypothetical protein C8Q75DRAFT_10744 [Abortiporus biennis]